VAVESVDTPIVFVPVIVCDATAAVDDAVLVPVALTEVPVAFTV
jgi:hypothetical protein